MKKLYYTFLLFIFSINFNNCFAGTFTSISSGTWNDPLTWSASGDPDGIPDSDDVVTIANGFNVSVSGSGHSCLDLTVDGTLTLNSFCNLIIWGDYSLNGTEAGSNGSITFKSQNGVISGSGSFGSLIRYSWVAARYTISSEVTILKSVQCSAGNGQLTNNGYIRFAKIYGNNESFINNSGATLEFSSREYNQWFVTLNATAAGNTVMYTLNNYTVDLIQPVSNQYGNLLISGTPSSKRMIGNLEITGNLTLQSSGILKTQGFDLSIGGNVIKNSGTNFIRDAGTTVTFNGSNPQSITFSGSLTFEDIIFDNPSTVTFNSGSFTVSNSFTVNQGSVNVGSNLFTLSSNSSKTAYIGFSNGTISGNMTIQRFVTARNDGYSDMSSPLSNGTFAQLSDDFAMLFVPYVLNSSVPSAWGYDESAWDYVAIESSGTSMTPGVGYEVYLDNDGDENTTFSSTTIDFLGTPNIGNIPVPVTVDNDGWNLVGNPYAAHIDWANFQSNAGVAMNGTFQFYDETIEDFSSASSGDIAPGQGFWIEATAAGNATFQESNKTTNTSSTFRSTSNNSFSLRVSSPFIKQTSNTYIQLNEDASLAYEKDMDLTFLRVPNPEAPSLYTKSIEGKNLRISTFNALDKMSIPVYFVPGKDGQYSISANHIESILYDGYDEVILEDLTNGARINLISESYSFEATTNDDNNRFVLHLSKSSLNEINNEVSFLNAADGVFVNFNSEESKNASINVFNVAGQEIIESKNVNTDSKTISIQLPQDYQGMYIIRVIIDEMVITQRFYKN